MRSVLKRRVQFRRNRPPRVDPDTAHVDPEIEIEVTIESREADSIENIWRNSGQILFNVLAKENANEWKRIKVIKFSLFIVQVAPPANRFPVTSVPVHSSCENRY